MTTVIGRSGGGKSVLLKHMIRLLKPDRGQVLVDGVDITRLGPRELNEVRKKFAMLFQGAALFDSLTVFENVAFPLREKTKLKEAEIEGKVLEMLDQVGLTGMGHKFPAELSGGMGKRAGLGGRQGGPVAMSDTKLEMIVGVFVLIGITALTYLAVKLGKLEVIGGGNQVEIQAEFDSVAGLKTGASVEIAGVPVGHVKRITLNGERALVTFVIKPGVKLYGDSIASVKTRGLIGDKYVSISPGGSQKELTPGSKIRDTESGVDLESLIGEFIHGNVK